MDGQRIGGVILAVGAFWASIATVTLAEEAAEWRTAPGRDSRTSGKALPAPAGLTTPRQGK